MKSSILLVFLVNLVVCGLAQAAPVGVDGVFSAEWVGYAPKSVAFDPNAPMSDFFSPSNVSNSVGYDIYIRSDADYLYGAVVAGGGIAGLNFWNVYIDTNPFVGGSDLGFEVTNNRAFKPGGSGYYTPSGADFAYASNGTGIIEFALSRSFLESDPLGIGFPVLTALDNDVRFNLSQAFGYSVAGGSFFYGSERLGLTEFEAASPVATPEPGTMLLMGIGAAGVAFMRRRKMTASN